MAARTDTSLIHTAKNDIPLVQVSYDSHHLRKSCYFRSICNKITPKPQLSAESVIHSL